jgi:hypothetical protein
MEPGNNIVTSKIKSKSGLIPFFIIVIAAVFSLTSCAAQFGQVVISKPDEFRHIYEAKEIIVLKAIARIFKDKSMGSAVKINQEKHTVESDYVTQGEWRTKSEARVKKLRWNECEVVMSITTEKKTEKGWEMRRLLDEEQYITLFDAIELQIYQEMTKID